MFKESPATRWHFRPAVSGVRDERPRPGMPKDVLALTVHGTPGVGKRLQPQVVSDPCPRVSPAGM
jgi:hypothetical protein